MHMTCSVVCMSNYLIKIIRNVSTVLILCFFNNIIITRFGVKVSFALSLSLRPIFTSLTDIELFRFIDIYVDLFIGLIL